MATKSTSKNVFIQVCFIKINLVAQKLYQALFSESGRVAQKRCVLCKNTGCEKERDVCGHLRYDNVFLKTIQSDRIYCAIDLLESQKQIEMLIMTIGQRLICNEKHPCYRETVARSRKMRCDMASWITTVLNNCFQDHCSIAVCVLIANQGCTPLTNIVHISFIYPVFQMCLQEV